MTSPSSPLSCWGSDVVKFVLHLAEAIKRESQLGFLQGLEDTAGLEAVSSSVGSGGGSHFLTFTFVSYLSFLSLQFHRPMAHLSQMG